MNKHRLNAGQGMIPAVFAGLLLACLQISPVAAQESDVFVLKSSEWNVPRTSDSILAMPALNKTVQAFSKHPGARIQIRYPGGDEGTLWATELRSWLVALGIASRHIELLPGSRDPEQLELRVIAPPTRDHG
jgi:hypothetical protein